MSFFKSATTSPTRTPKSPNRVSASEDNLLVKQTPRKSFMNMLLFSSPDRGRDKSRLQSPERERGKSPWRSFTSLITALSRKPSSTRTLRNYTQEDLNNLINEFGETRVNEIHHLIYQFGIESAKDVLEMRMLLENASNTLDTAPKRNSWVPIMRQIKYPKSTYKGRKKKTMDRDKILLLGILGSLLIFAVVARVMVRQLWQLRWATGAVFSVAAAGFTAAILVRQSRGQGAGLLPLQTVGLAAIECSETLQETLTASSQEFSANRQLYALLVIADSVMMFVAVVFLFWFKYFGEDDVSIYDGCDVENSCVSTPHMSKAKNAAFSKTPYGNEDSNGSKKKAREKSPMKEEARNNKGETRSTLEEIRMRNSGSLLELRNRIDHR